MKFAKMKCMTAVATALFTLLAIPGQLAAQDQRQHQHKFHHYQFIDLGTFGGPTSGINTEPTQSVINNAGRVVGVADTSIPTPEPGCYNPVGNPDCFIAHAFEWTGDAMKDLGTLPGGNFSFAAAINRHGQIAGVSENDQIDPATGNPEFHAVVWDHNRILDLGTLGGVSSFASTVNDRGQVVGPALNEVPDPYSILGLGSVTTLTQTRGFLWERGKMTDLGTLGGPDSWPVFLNNLGQVAGTSYTSDVVDPNTGIPPVGVFLWENGKMKNLGDFGGDNGLLSPYGIVDGLNNRGQVVGNMMLPGNQYVHAFMWNGRKLSDLGTLGGNYSAATAINDKGEVVGLGWFPGDQTKDAFLWRNGVMTDLGTVDGDICSDARSINSKGQVVGASQDAAGRCNTWTHAFFWEAGSGMIDLNTLIPSGSDLQLSVALGINEHGEIVGEGFPPDCTDMDHCSFDHAYLLIPCDENHPNVEGCDYSLVDPVAAPQRPVRRDLPVGTRPPNRSPRTNRFHTPGLQLPSR
jgi:probable HAF family extracellular repeat protein